MTVISELLSTTYSTKSFLHSTAANPHHYSALQHFNPGLEVCHSHDRTKQLCRIAINSFLIKSPKPFLINLHLNELLSCTIDLMVQIRQSIAFCLLSAVMTFSTFCCNNEMQRKIRVCNVNSQ